MRFLLDQEVYSATAAFLTTMGHDLVAASHLGLSQASDEATIEAAQADNRILVTRDRDFGALVFLGGIRTGVIYLRVSPATLQAAHEELGRVLAEHSPEELSSAFVTVEPGRHRFRKLPP